MKKLLAITLVTLFLTPWLTQKSFAQDFTQRQVAVLQQLGNNLVIATTCTTTNPFLAAPITFGTWCLNATTGHLFVWNGTSFVDITTGAGGSPAGTNGDVQINSSGVFGAAAANAFNFSTGTSILTVPGLTITQGLILSGVITPTQLTTNTNDYAPTGFATASVIRISASASIDLTGLAGGAAGIRKTLHNITAGVITLRSESASSAAANRFSLNADVPLAVNQSITLWYDSTSSRWRPESGSAVGTGTVTTFTSGNLSPLFTTSVATPTTTPALTFTLTNQTANTSYFGPTTGAATTPTMRLGTKADLQAWAQVIFGDQPNTFNLGQKQSFRSNATNAGLGLTPFAGDPSTLSDGDFWCNSSTFVCKFRINGATQTIGTLLAESDTFSTVVGRGRIDNTFNSFANRLQANDSTLAGCGLYTHVTLGPQIACWPASGVENDLNWIRKINAGFFWEIQSSAGTSISRLTESTGKWTNFQLDVEGTGNTITTVSYLSWEAAGCNNATASTGMDLPTANAPTPACFGTTTTQGVLAFADGSTQSASRHWRLPSDITGATDIDLDWFANAASTNAVRWSVATGCVADGEAISTGPSYNTASASNTAYTGTANQRKTTSFTGVATTNCAAGKTFYVQVQRIGADAGDTLVADANLLEIGVKQRRAQ